MSYGRLQHDNQSSHHINFSRTSYTDSEDDVDYPRKSGRKGPTEDFELEDLSHARGVSDDNESPFDPELELEDWQSDEETSVIYGKARRASASTVQSFMLYTPDEEKSVIKKFDRRLVLFVALLYMLSFLDRSSTFKRVVTAT